MYVVTLLSLVACAVTETNFIDRLVEAQCAAEVRCYGADAVDGIVGESCPDVRYSLYTDVGDECGTEQGGTFDAVAAQACLDAWASWACDDSVDPENDGLDDCAAFIDQWCP